VAIFERRHVVNAARTSSVFLEIANAIAANVEIAFAVGLSATAMQRSVAAGCD
jgi:hypothetical protein